MDHFLPILLDDLAALIGEIAPEQGPWPTPCPGFNVATLQQHVLGWLNAFAVTLSDPEGRPDLDPPSYRGPAQADAAAAEVRRTTEVVRQSLAAGLEQAKIQFPLLGGELPGPVVIDSLAGEVIGHGWDLAVATGREWNPDPAACESALATLKSVVLPEYRGPGMPFGPEVVVADNAPALERLLAFTGRDPGRTPTLLGSAAS